MINYFHKSIDIIYHIVMPIILSILLAFIIINIKMEGHFKYYILIICCAFTVSSLFKYGYIVSMFLGISSIIILSLVLNGIYQTAHMEIDFNYFMTIFTNLIALALGSITGYFANKRFHSFIISVSNKYSNNKTEDRGGQISN
jgi:hypothetical protein